MLLFALGPKGGTSANLFEELGGFIAERYECRLFILDFLGKSFLANFCLMLRYLIRHVRDVFWADMVIFHVVAGPSILLISLARLLRRKVVIFQWDIYPTTISGVAYDKSRSRHIMLAAERVCMRLANVIVLPSGDFLPHTEVRNSVIVPLWPQGSLSLAPISAQEIESDTLHVAFAGQVNETRGLRECVAHLAAHSSNRIILHTFSTKKLSSGFEDAAGRVRVEQHGVVSRHELQKRLMRMHFGLVSLSPSLDQPGFPSKTFDYLASGLPIIYFGRPLESYVADIKQFDVGVDITKCQKFDLSQLYTNLIAKLEEGREGYISHTRLNWSRFAKIC